MNTTNESDAKRNVGVGQGGGTSGEVSCSAEHAYMLSGVMRELNEIRRRVGWLADREGGELQTFEDAMRAAIIAADMLDARIDADTLCGVFCYELHDSGTAIDALYHALAVLAADDDVTGTSVAGVVASFLAARPDLPLNATDER